MKTAVVILNWNGLAMLQRFLPSVIANSPEAEVIVADNGSTDASVDYLREHYPTLRLILLDKNYGFAEGYNRALAQVEADYYVLLNDDVEVTPHWITPVLSTMQDDPTIGIAQPKMLMYDQRDTFEYAGGAGGYIDRYGYPFCRGRMFSTLEQDVHQYDTPCDIFWASGAAMFVRADVWKQVGGLDGDFFAHMEEIDFCWRAKLQGYRAVYCPQSVVYHVGGGTLPKSSPTKTRLNFRNNNALLYKNLPLTTRRRTLRIRAWLDMVAALKSLLTGHADECRAILAARKEYRTWKPALDRKRTTTIDKLPPCTYNRLILTDYYLQRRRTFSQLPQQHFL